MERRIPLSGLFETNYRCNLQCVHCYVNLPAKDLAAQKRELTLPEIDRIFAELAQAGTWLLALTGGELMLRPDWWDIYMLAKRKGFLTILFTNATMVTPAVAEKLTQYPPYSIEITLYGRTRETYEKLTKIPGSYDKCLRGIRLLLEKKLPVKLKTVALTINAHEVLAMKQFAHELGLPDFRWDADINPRIDGSKGPLAYRLSPKEIVALETQDHERSEMFRRTLPLQYEMSKRMDSSDVYSCGAGLNGFTLNPYGELQLCALSRKPSFDLRRGSFREGWDGIIKETRFSKRTSSCATSSDVGAAASCANCPGWSEMENGDPEKTVAFAHDLALLRIKAFAGEKINKEVFDV